MTKNPCRNHKLAFHDKKVAELLGMAKNDVRFKICESCGWIIKESEI